MESNKTNNNAILKNNNHDNNIVTIIFTTVIFSIHVTNFLLIIFILYKVFKLSNNNVDSVNMLKENDKKINAIKETTEKIKNKAVDAVDIRAIFNTALTATDSNSLRFFINEEISKIKESKMEKIPEDIIDDFFNKLSRNKYNDVFKDINKLADTINELKTNIDSITENTNNENYKFKNTSNDNARLIRQKINKIHNDFYNNINNSNNNNNLKNKIINFFKEELKNLRLQQEQQE